MMGYTIVSYSNAVALYLNSLLVKKKNATYHLSLQLVVIFWLVEGLA